MSKGSRDPYPQFELLGDSALVVHLGDRMQAQTFHRLRRLLLAWQRANVGEDRIWVPSYASITVHFDPFRERVEDIIAEANRMYEIDVDDRGEARHWTIPVRYGGVDAPDLEEVARMHNMTKNDVIELHTSVEYIVYFLGFSPGFPYLGTVDPRIASPRRKEVRARVPVGAVGIAGQQTGIYSQAGPGGWQIIGRTDVTLFDPSRSEPCLLAPGDRVSFKSVGDIGDKMRD